MKLNINRVFNNFTFPSYQKKNDLFVRKIATCRDFSRKLLARMNHFGSENRSFDYSRFVATKMLM